MGADNHEGGHAIHTMKDKNVESTKSWMTKPVSAVSFASSKASQKASQKVKLVPIHTEVDMTLTEASQKASQKVKLVPIHNNEVDMTLTAGNREENKENQDKEVPV